VVAHARVTKANLASQTRESLIDGVSLINPQLRIAALVRSVLDTYSGFCHALRNAVAASNLLRHDFGPCGPVQSEKRFLVNPTHADGSKQLAPKATLKSRPDRMKSKTGLKQRKRNENE
jgi:hypothetical protein